MALRRLFIGALVVEICLLTGTKIVTGSPGDQTPDLSSLSEADLKTVTVRFERTVCYGTCPAYTVTLHGDGGIEYSGKSHVKQQGTRERRIDPGPIKTLMREFARAKFLSLSDDYSGEKCSCRRCTDMPTAITELSVSGLTHRVNHYYGCACAPKTLFELESAIDKLAGTEQWTGDVSKQGPYGTTCFGG